ncbi:MAG: HAMP domain-containing sensor histidine kinase [Cyanobacteria bacterium J06629_2]
MTSEEIQEKHCQEIVLQLIEAIEQELETANFNSFNLTTLQASLSSVCHSAIKAVAERNPSLLVISELDNHSQQDKISLSQNLEPEKIAQDFFGVKKSVLTQLQPKLLKSSPAEIIEQISLLDLAIKILMQNCLNRYSELRRQQIKELHHQIFLTNQEIKRLIADHQDNLDYLIHEIKNPLTSIIGYSDLYLRLQHQHNLSPTNLNHIQQVLQQGRNALRLVNDTLELSSYQEGKLKLKMRQIQICTLIDDIVLSLSSNLESKNIDLITSCIPEQLTVECDYLRLQQIVTNLLTNAIRYTPSGTITLTCQIIEQNILEIQIVDTGVGISASDCDRIFEPYFRSRTAQENAPSGTGLGLAIVAQLVNILEGEIRLDSQLDQGSTFIVRIPITRSAKD